MGFFRRDKGDPAGQDARAGERNGSQMPAAATEDLAQVVVEGMSEAPIERETLELLQIGLPHLIQRECSDEAIVAGQTAARLGYLSRAAEFAMFEGDLGPDENLVATLGESLEQAERDGTSGSDAMAELAAAIAAGESVDPPPHEGGPSWTLPGLSGADRGVLRDDLLSRMQQHPPDIDADDLKRTWKYGYFLCALDELCEE